MPLEKKKDKNLVAYVLISGSVWWKSLCCMRCQWLEDRRWRPNIAQRRRLKAGHGCDPSVQTAWTLPLPPMKKQVPVIFFFFFLAFLNHFKTAVSLKARQTTGTHSSIPLSGFVGHPQVSPIPGAKDWFAVGCVWAAHCVGEHQGAITPCWSLRGTVTKPETTWAKLGTYSLKLW